MKIMVALRPGEQHSVAIDRAVGIAGQQPAELLLFTAVYDEHIAGLRFGLDSEMQLQQSAAVSKELGILRAAAETVRAQFTSVKVEARWAYPTADAIVAMAADFSATLLILAASEHSVLGRLFLTSTDWEVMRQATIPVLLAKNTAFRPYKTIMVAVDPTHAHDEPAALDYKLINSAKHIAEPFDGELFLAHAAPSMASMIAGDYVPNAQEVARVQQAHIDATNFLADQVNIDRAHVRIENDIPRWALSRMAREMDADLVALGSVSRSLLSRLLIGKTTEAVLGELECDVLVVASEAP